ncbi:MAG: tannase/feruloyl esterase family alpha/beta hydrolase [Rhodoferax sp.]|nr:tannase/feruloyl esterase family alpha/beta hydrolase [Rhodoferax sp.]
MPISPLPYARFLLPALLCSASAWAAEPLACEQLAGLTLAADSIALPTRGAAVTSAKLVTAGGTAPKTFGDYCLVAGEIQSVDSAAPPIQFQIALPAQWNRKVLMLGGGGYDGTVPNVAGNLPAGPTQLPNPIGRGYAVFGSNSGHAGASNQGGFGLNDEALRNFAFEALKKTRDTALQIVARHYALPVQRSYFAGGSTGGREALAVTQKWPQDFDGAIVLYPAFNAASLDLQFGRITRALAAPGAYPSLAKRKALYDAALQACDGLDGVADGLISNQAACNNAFNPATAMLNGQPLRCADGADTGDNCLSDAQIKALHVINTPVKFNYPLANGETQYPGFNVWGTDFGRPGSGSQAVVNFLGLNSVAPASPMPAVATAPQAGVPYHAGFWDHWVKYFVTRDPGFDALTLDPERPGQWAARISELTGLQDANQTDFSAFAAHGGKILMAHGTSDQLVSTRATEQYYARIRASMGTERTDGFLRYYEIPGYNHAVSTTFNAAWDSLGALENWVEHGTAPTDPLVFDTAGVPGRSRPLCPYPSWPRYDGKGDVNAASSFVCVTQ